MNSVVKPAKTKPIRLMHTLSCEEKTWAEKRFELDFKIPAWIAERNSLLWHARLVTTWTSNACWLFDPIHGDHTRDRYLRDWETVLKSRDTWLNRDKEPCVSCQIVINELHLHRINVIAEFLEVARETLLVAVVVSEALKRTKDDGPCWNDFQILKAGSFEAA